MKKSIVKRELKNSMKEYYDKGFTNTADKMLKTLNNKLDKIWK